MQSWTLIDNKKFNLETIDKETDLKSQAKVKISRASISASDIAEYLGKYGELPLVPTRSALGLISESKSHYLQKGQRVFLTPYSKNDENLNSIRGVTSSGYLSDFANVPLENILIIPESIKDEDATFIEDVALAIKTFKKLEIKKTNYVLLAGCSLETIILAQLCMYFQAIPIMVDKDDTMLSKSEEYGIYYTINPSSENPIIKINEITSGKKIDKLIINTDAFEDLDPDVLNIMAENSSIALVGYNKSLPEMNVNISQLVEKKISIYGINDGQNELEPAINYLATGIIKVDSLVDHTYMFNEVPEVFYDLSSKRLRFKTLIKC